MHFPRTKFKNKRNNQYTIFHKNFKKSLKHKHYYRKFQKSCKKKKNTPQDSFQRVNTFFFSPLFFSENKNEECLHQSGGSFPLLCIFSLERVFPITNLHFPVSKKNKIIMLLCHPSRWYTAFPYSYIHDIFDVQTARIFSNFYCSWMFQRSFIYDDLFW